MNKVIVRGRFTADPDIRFSGENNSVCIARFTLAVRRNYIKEGQPEADFVGCVAKGKTAEFIDKYCGKGDDILVDGCIQTGNYTNKKGEKVYYTDLFAEKVEKISWKKEDPAEAEQKQEETVGKGFIDIPESADEEGLPFT